MHAKRIALVGQYASRGSLSGSRGLIPTRLGYPWSAGFYICIAIMSSNEV